MWSVCSTPGCPTVHNGKGKCDEHRAEAERARGTKQQRGYDSAYTKARNRAVASADTCAACGQPFTAANPATGGHVKAQRIGGKTSDGVEAQCRRCNYGWRASGL